MANTSGTKRPAKRSKSPSTATTAGDRNLLLSRVLVSRKLAGSDQPSPEARPKAPQLLRQFAHKLEDAATKAQRGIIREITERVLAEESRELAEAQGPRGVRAGERGDLLDNFLDNLLSDMLEREAAEFSAAAGHATALAGAALEAAKAGNDRIEENNARLAAALAAFQNRG